jgi:acylphosphatase
MLKTMALSPQRRLRAIVRGRVQGVFFRAWTQEVAMELGLSGWVRNTPDGAVEIVAEGPLPQLEDLVERCHQGPLAAKVTRVEVQWEDVRSDLNGFQVRR